METSTAVNRKNNSTQIVSGIWPQTVQASPKALLDSGDEKETFGLRQETC